MYTNYSPFSNEPLSNKKFNFTNSEKQKQGEFDPFTKNTVTAEDIYKTSFLMLQEHPKTNYNPLNETNEAIKNLSCNSELSKIFFSDTNIKRVQRLLKKEIFNRSNGKYKMEVDQDEKELVYVMRAIYIEFAKFIPNQIVRQVKILNNKVIEQIMPSVISSIKHKEGYLKRINNPVIPIQLPINVNNAGRNLLPGFSTIWEF